MTSKSVKMAKKSLSIRKVNYFMALCTLIISALLLVATHRANTGYQQMRDATANYIQWEREANDLQAASDYLTEQARGYAVTGEREYLDNYFEEANVARRRDNAVERIRAILGESDAYEALEAAMAESRALMTREYYAMRLTIEANGQDPNDFPAEIQAVALSDADAALSAEAKSALARAMVFDEVYREKKAAISANMQSCVNALVREINGQQSVVMNRLRDILSKQRVLIAFTIIITLVTLLATRLLVISPLLHAVLYIRADQPIPVKGSHEFQFLARTYNLMYEANREQREQLAYEATHDQLTGIYNRAGYDFFLKNTDWETSALVLFDVDKFKPVNDTYGHEAGDRVLMRVADTIKRSFRSQDYVCRIGGDEFAVIMVHVNETPAQLIHDKVSRINDALSAAQDSLPSIHLSCGAAYGTLTEDVDALFRHADAALYRVKHSGGRGCEVCA